MKSLTEQESLELANKNPLQQKEFLIRQKVQQYVDHTKVTKKQIKKLERIRKRISRDHFKQQVISQLLANDQEEAEMNHKSTDEAINILQKTSNYKLKSYEEQAESLQQLHQNIEQRVEEVQGKIRNLHEAVLEWQTANYIVNTQCQSSVLDNVESFQAWNQYTPILNTYLSNESKIHYSVYLSAQLLGLIDELDAQKDIKQILQDFADKNYPDISKVKALPLKQINDNRQARSEAFDQLHWKLIKQLRYYVRQCDNLQNEIEEREYIRLVGYHLTHLLFLLIGYMGFFVRGKFVSIAMELKNCIEQDYQQSLESSDNNAKLPVDKILSFFKPYSFTDKEITSQLILNSYVSDEEEEEDDEGKTINAKNKEKESKQNHGKKGREDKTADRKTEIMKDDLISSLYQNNNDIIANAEEGLIKEMNDKLQSSSGYYDPKIVAISNESKEILFQILQRLLEERESKRFKKLQKHQSEKLSSALDTYKMNSSSMDRQDNAREPQSGEEPDSLHNHLTNSHNGFDQPSMISSLSDSIANGYHPNSPKVTLPPRFPNMKIGPSPAPPRSANTKKSRQGSRGNRPKSSGVRFRPSSARLSTKPEQDEDDTNSEERNGDRGNEDEDETKLAKNLLEEYRIMTGQKVNRNPLATTKRYIETIRNDVENMINDVFPELQFTFNALLSEPFQHTPSSPTKGLSEITQKIRDLQLNSPRNSLIAGFKPVSPPSQHGHGHSDLVFKQSFESVVEGMYAIKALQKNCATVANEAIVTVSNLLSKMKTSDFDEYLSDSIKGRSPRGKATSPRRKRKDYIPLESVSEIDQYIAAQQLIAEISHQFATNKSMLESWFISSTVEEFKTAKRLLEEKFQSLGLPTEPPAKDTTKKEKKSKSKGSNSGNSQNHSLDAGSSYLSPMKGQLTKIMETDHEDGETETENEGGDAEESFQEEIERKQEQYRQMVQKQRLNTEVIRKSFEVPQILDLLSVGEDETEKSVQSFLQQSEVLLNSIHNTIQQDDTESEKLSTKFPTVSIDSSDSFFNVTPAPGPIHSKSARGIGEGSAIGKTNSRPTSNALRRYNSDDYKEVEEKMKLIKLELVMKGDLYYVSFQYYLNRKALFIHARYHIQKSMFREYKFFLPLEEYSKLIVLDSDESESFLVQDSVKACQGLIKFFRVEFIEKNALFEYLREKELPLWTTNIPFEEIERLIKLYEEEKISFTHAAVNHQRQESQMIPDRRQDSTIVKVLTIRDLEEKLVAFAIPTIRTVSEKRGLSK